MYRWARWRGVVRNPFHYPFLCPDWERSLREREQVKERTFSYLHHFICPARHYWECGDSGRRRTTIDLILCIGCPSIEHGDLRVCDGRPKRRAGPYSGIHGQTDEGSILARRVLGPPALSLIGSEKRESKAKWDRQDGQSLSLHASTALSLASQSTRSPKAV